jgi:molybdenum cofactor biosynthesis enzyme MoaA
MTKSKPLQNSPAKPASSCASSNSCLWTPTAIGLATSSFRQPKSTSEATPAGLEQIPHERSETARKYRFADGAPGEIGLIAPVTQPFCGHCSRIRLTADGKLRTCLFSKDDHDLRALLREGASDEDLVTYISSIVMEKEEGHRINEPGFVPPSRTMVFIGG